MLYAILSSTSFNHLEIKEVGGENYSSHDHGIYGLLVIKCLLLSETPRYTCRPPIEKKLSSICVLIYVGRFPKKIKKISVTVDRLKGNLEKYLHQLVQIITSLTGSTQV